MFRKQFLYVGALSLAVIPFIPIFRVIDRIGPQYLYLSFIQILFTLILLSAFRKKLSAIRFKIIPIYFYMGFILVSVISILFSSHKEEGILEWFKHFTNFHSLVNITLFFYLLPKRKQIFSYIFLVMGLIESLYIFYIFCDYFTFSETFSRIRELQGFSSNQNVASFSLLIKLPILFNIFKNNKSKILRILSALAIVVCAFDIQVIASRGALLGAVIIIILMIIAFFIQINKTSKNLNLRFLFLIVLISITVVAQNLLISSRNSSLASTNRIVSYNDSSVEYRLGYIYDTLNHLTKYPIIGTGIGTWKIYSTEYISKDKATYEAPYHAHNDFLQIFAETGILGGFFYLMVFCSSIIILIINIVKSGGIYIESLSFYIILCLLVYCLDASINFPRIRPYSQMNIIYVLGLFFSLKMTNENEG